MGWAWPRGRRTKRNFWVAGGTKVLGGRPGFGVVVISRIECQARGERSPGAQIPVSTSLAEASQARVGFVGPGGRGANPPDVGLRDNPLRRIQVESWAAGTSPLVHGSQVDPSRPPRRLTVVRGAQFEQLGAVSARSAADLHHDRRPEMSLVKQMWLESHRTSFVAGRPPAALCVVPGHPRVVTDVGVPKVVVGPSTIVMGWSGCRCVVGE